MVPTQFSRLLGLGESTRSGYSISSLQRVIHGGAPCPVEVKRKMIEWLGPILSETYGATEGGGTRVDSKDWLKYPGTVGKPLPGTRLRILSDDGEELPPGSIGTIYMTRSMGDRFHYLGDPEKTRACQRGDFFTAGDVGYVNEEGFLFLSDRKIDMIVRSGSKVYSAQIENVLAAHAKVADCAVFGIPDELTGEAVMAVVEPVASVAPDRALRMELLRFLAQRLSAGMVPRRLVFTSRLPREETGKLQKRRLRELYGKDASAQ
jgi:long-chain acyl-CoA synthetase